VEPDAVAEVERLHAAVIEAEEERDRGVAGPILRRRVSRARASEQSLLEGLGFDSYIDFRIRVAATTPPCGPQEKGMDVNDWFPKEVAELAGEPELAPEPEPPRDAETVETTLETLRAQASAFVAAQVRGAEAEADRIVEAARAEATAMLARVERIGEENEAARVTAEQTVRRLARLESHLDGLAAIVEAVPDALRTLRLELARAVESLSGAEPEHPAIYDVEREVNAAV
jgi:hypothetical protein